MSDAIRCYLGGMVSQVTETSDVLCNRRMKSCKGCLLVLATCVKPLQPFVIPGTRHDVRRRHTGAPSCPSNGAVSHGRWVQPFAGLPGLREALMAAKRSTGREGPSSTRKRGKSEGRKPSEDMDARGKEEQEKGSLDEGELSQDDGEEEEEYIFDASDFPMLEGVDFFGDFEGLEDVEEEVDAGVQVSGDEEEGLTTDTAAVNEARIAEALPAKKAKKAKLPVLAVIGRPNVGKSTIVNRICRTMSSEPGAIVYDYEGVTRDRIYRRAEWNERLFQVVDTGGLIFDEDEDNLFAAQIREQALIALDEAVAAIFVVDGQTGVTTLDEEIARFLRLKKKPIYVAVNKCESLGTEVAQASVFWMLGLGTPYAVSGLHGTGIADLLEDVKPHLYEVAQPEKDEMLNVAIVGRPNVGKSSLLNRLCGKERAIVSDVAGTTRDAVDVTVERDGREYTFVDTAGIRRRKKVEYGNEYLMVNRALKAIRRSDITLLVIDVVDGIKDQDKILAQRIAEDGRACVIIANKWDAVEKDDKTYNAAVEYIKEELFAVNWAEVVFTSALTGQRCQKIFEAVDRAAKAHRKRVKTSVLNEVLAEALAWQRPPAVKSSQQGKIYYCNQASVEPPTVVVFCNNPKLFPESYRRYLDRKFRESLDLTGTPIRWLFRGKRLRDVARTRSKPVPYGMP